MCGIAVAIDWDGAEQASRRLLGHLIHRGDVDDPIISPQPRVAMGTRRLRIVDAEGGEQPKMSADERILVSFNGEIYNHITLRVELEALGVRFHSQSDTEVLANALSIWGSAALPQLEGMFSFVAYDIRSGDFLAARDPFGVKPLYLIAQNGGFLFASEIRPLLRASDYGDVLFLPPGHLLTRNTFRRFARSPKNQTPKVLSLDHVMRDAVHSRVPPDLPFALLFSGGIDSTLVAHYARELRPLAPGYFLGDEHAPDYEYAIRYAESTGLDLRRVSLPVERLLSRERLAEVISTVETFEPCVVRDAICNYALFERIHADGYRVALSGEGADELFAGYVPLEIAFGHRQEAGEFVRSQALGIMHRTNLQRLDRCAMRFQVEAREPLLDSQLAAYALSLDARTLVSGLAAGFSGKQPLRNLFDHYTNRLPAEIRRRRKLAQHVGSGLDSSQNISPLVDWANAMITDSEFAEGQREYAPFQPTSKEEVLYLRLLSEQVDLHRVPHLRVRPFLTFPSIELDKEAAASLGDYLVTARDP